MKKLKYKILKVMAFSVIMLFMSSTVFAQVQESQQDTTAQDTTTQKNDQQQTLPQEQNQRTSDKMQSQDPDDGVNYSETIDQSELPQDVNSSLDELYPAHEINEVYRGEDDSYKVKVKNENDEAVVYYNSEGKFLRAENLSGLQQEGALPQEQGQRTMESQDNNQWGTDNRQKQGTQQGQMGTDEDDGQNQQGTMHDQRTHQGTGTDHMETHGTQQGQYGTNADDKQNQQGTMQNKPGTQKKTGTDDIRAQQGTQQGQWGTQDGNQNADKRNESSTYSQEQNQQSDDELRSQDYDKGVDYSETVQESDLPQAVTSSLDELYPAHEIEKVYQGNDDSFKVKMKNKDDKAVVYYDSEGEFLRAQNMSGLQQEGALPQEQGQRTQDQENWSSDDRQNQQDPQQGQIGTGTVDKGKKQGSGTTWSDENQTESQEQNQRIQNVEESQDADRWGTENRMPEQERSQDANQRTWESDTTNTDESGTQSENFQNESSAYPQEQNQQIEDTRNQIQEYEDTGAEESRTWSQERDQQTTRADELKSQGERRIDEWGSQDTTETQGQYGTDSPTGTTNNQRLDQENDQNLNRQDDNTLDSDDSNRMDGTASPQEQYQATMDSDIEYSEEIQESELPESVNNSLDDLYPDHEIEKAYRGDDGSFKVKVKNNEDKVTVYYDSDGLFNREENLNDMQKDKNKNTNQDW